MGAGARGRGGAGGVVAAARVGAGASEASAETVAPTFDHTRRERSERRDGSGVLAKMARRRRRAEIFFELAKLAPGRRI